MKGAQKHRLYRNYAKNFPQKWCEKFDQPEFDEYRLEFAENRDLDEDEFNELLEQPFLTEKKCAGNFALLVCLANKNNDEQNA